MQVLQKLTCKFAAGAAPQTLKSGLQGNRGCRRMVNSPEIKTMPVTPNAENTFTIVRRPLKDSERKTLERLMTMQKDVQRGRSKLAERRGRENVVHGRGGRDWVVRKTVTKLVHVEIGQKFTIHVSHNILPDLRSVEQYLEVA